MKGELGEAIDLRPAVEPATRRLAAGELMTARPGRPAQLACVDGPADATVTFAQNAVRVFASLLDFYWIAWQYEPRPPS